MATEFVTNRPALGRWVATNTELPSIADRLFEDAETGLRAWARTTAGMVVLLFGLQLVTGILLAFHYVPSAESAYTTVAYIEQAVDGGTWIRSLHYHASILLPIALLAHLAQMIFRGSFTRNPTAWSFGIVFLALVLAAAATGYALPWDARSLNGVNVAVSLAGNAPLLGEELKTWLQTGESISTVTLSRFYALHVFATPTLIVITIVARVFIFGRKSEHRESKPVIAWRREQMLRNAIVVGALFTCVAAFSAKYPAPLAPAMIDTANFLPRPGPQFLWLFEMQKYTDGIVAALLAFGFPAVVLGGLLLAPRLVRREIAARAVATIFGVTVMVVGGLTTAAYVQDAIDPRTAEQLAKQLQDEAVFRLQPFKPRVIQAGKQESRSDAEEAVTTTNDVPLIEIPNAYIANCAKCHGASAEGKGAYPELLHLTTREEDKLTDEDLLQIINDPGSFGLSAKMPSYENKLTEEEKQEIIRWLKSL